MPGDNVFLSSKNGNVIKGSVLKGSSVTRSDVAGTSKELNLLFDVCCKFNSDGGKNQIDSHALNLLFGEFSKAAGDDNILTSQEIAKYLKDKNLNGKVSVKAVEEFFANISDATIVDGIHNAIDGAGTSSSISDCLSSIPPAKMSKVLNMYKKEYKISLVQDICDEFGSFGSTREGYLNIIRDKIAATKNPTEAKGFKAKFDAEIKRMNLTFLSSTDASNLEKIILDAAAKSKYPKPRKRSAQELEKENRKLISQMMNNPDLCRTTDDKNRIVDRIMKYAELNNPRDLIEEYTKSSDARVREAAQNLLNSTFLDYFPTFVASIIAQESQFRETDNDPQTGVFTNSGKGVMQLTSAVAGEIVANPGHFNDDFIKRLGNYCNVKDSTSVKNAYSSTSQRSVVLNYDVGTAVLRNHLRTYFNRIKGSKDGSCYKEYMNMGVDLANPATIMEIVAMSYNGNSAGKRDDAHDNSLSQVKYVYAREVIERFRTYTPSDVDVNYYFDYNPKTKKFVEVKK